MAPENDSNPPGGSTAVAEPAAASAASTPGDNDLAVTGSTNPNPDVKQVTQTDEGVVPAEGQRIRDKARADAEERNVVTLADTLSPEKSPLSYDKSGALVNQDGKRIALSADATDIDVGWTVQHARPSGKGDKRQEGVAYPGGPATIPDQTFHPDELPDPLAAIQAGLLPQNAEVLNIDPDKFKGKKSLEA